MSTRFSLILLLLLIAPASWRLYAQTVSQRVYGDKTLEKAFKDNSDKVVDTQPRFDSKEKNDIRKSWNQTRLDQELEMLNTGSLLIHSPLQKFVDSLLQEIKQTNRLHDKYTVYVTDELNPNAFSTGDGYLFVNASLVEHLHSTEELEFILCHELAHDTLRHFNKKLKAHIDAYLDKQFQKELKEAARSENMPRAKAEFVLKSKMAQTMSNSRNAEFQADSLGLVFFTRLNKPATSAFNALWTLDDIDLQKSDKSVDLDKFCSEWMKGYFQPAWLEREEGSLGASAYKPPKLEDSLKTHPDIPLRIEHLVGHPVDKPGPFTVEPNFQRVVDQTEIELDFAWLEYGNFGRAFYRQVQRWETYKRSSDVGMIAVTVALFAKARKERNFAKRVSLEGEFFTDNYNRCLHLLNSMTYDNYVSFYKNLEAFCLAQPADPLTAELIASAQYIFKTIQADPPTAKRVCEDFLKEYPNGILQRFICTSNN